MRKSRRLAAALALACVAAAAAVTTTQAATDTGHVTGTVTLPADSPSPVLVGSGHLTLTADGSTVWCPFGCSTTYAAGTETGLGSTLACNADCTLPGAGVGAVLYRVGNGAWRELRATTTVSGRIEIAYNDDYFADNTGSYAVSVTGTGSLPG